MSFPGFGSGPRIACLLAARLFRAEIKNAKHPDRKRININDVLNSEPGIAGIKNQDNWKQQLIDSGVPKIFIPQKTDLKVSNDKDIPADLKPPEKNPAIDPGPLNPWDPNFKIKRIGRDDSKSNDSKKLMLLGGLGAAAYFMTRGK